MRRATTRKGSSSQSSVLSSSFREAIDGIRIASPTRCPNSRCDAIQPHLISGQSLPNFGECLPRPSFARQKITGRQPRAEIMIASKLGHDNTLYGTSFATTTKIHPVMKRSIQSSPASSQDQDGKHPARSRRVHGTRAGHSDGSEVSPPSARMDNLRSELERRVGDRHSGSEARSEQSAL